MAINLSLQPINNGRLGGTSEQWPLGQPRDDSSGDASDGTPVAMANFGDSLALNQWLLKRAGMTANNSPDDAEASQLGTALEGIIADAVDSLVPSASTTVQGKVQLSSSVASTSTTLAATPSAVKQAYDLASSKSGGATKTLLFDGGDGLESGTVVLSQSYKNFDYLEVIARGNSTWILSCTDISKESIELAQDNLARGATLFIVADYNRFWLVYATNETTFTHVDDNCRIMKIYGVKH